MGKKVETYVNFMENVARDDSHGYSQLHRYGNPDYDCSWLTIDALHHAGFPMEGATYTGNMDAALAHDGFTNVINQVDQTTTKGMKRGDILRKPGHVAVYCGNGMEVEAASDEYGGIEGRNPGDQTGWEICVQPYHPGWTGIWRFDEEEDVFVYECKTVWKGCTGNDVKRMKAILKGRGYKDNSKHVLKVDGVFDDKAEEALLKFQKAVKTKTPTFKVDGVCGPKTWKRLLYC